MISMWALVSAGDVEAYAGTIVLPRYLAHLRLDAVRFAAQATNCDGREPLVLTYLGEGRREEFGLAPEEHALGLIQSVCPGICSARLQLPRNDAQWHWKTQEPCETMRIYFAPATEVLADGAVRAAAADAYVSVSQSRLFVGRATVEAYLQAWLAHLGLPAAVLSLDFSTASAGIEFAAGALGGQLLLDDRAALEDLVRFAGLEPILRHVAELVTLDVDAPFQKNCGIFEDGVYVHLATGLRSAEGLCSRRGPQSRQD
jgi:hypothetical protein